MRKTKASITNEEFITRYSAYLQGIDFYVLYAG